MSSPRSSTIAEYIEAAPAEGRPHLRRLHALLKSAAPQAEEAIKWGTPFFVEPRFVFAFSAHKKHCSFAPPAAALAHFRKPLEKHTTTKGTLLLPYAEPLPEALICELAQYSVQLVRERQDDAFW
jgi:uncharacterized protein YdhG (YjbR/CyaY superfamily)